MRRIMWWMGKEAREQRAFLIILAVVIVFGSWAIVFLERGVPDKSKLPANAAGEWPHRMDRNMDWAPMLAGSLALALLAVSGGLFASDTRRGNIALTARTPGAWGAAFVGKLAFLWAVLLGTLLVHGVVLGRLAVLYHLMEGDKTVDVWWLGPTTPDAWNLIWAAFALAPLLVLTSVTLPWLGVPTVAGAALAAALVVPMLMWLDSGPFFLEAWIGGPRPLLLVAAVAGLGVAIWAWLRPVRAGSSARRVALSSLGALAVVVLGTHAATWAARERYLDFKPGEADVELDVVGIGPNGHYAFVNAYRGDPSPPSHGSAYRNHGTRSKPFILDLARGEARSTGGNLLHAHASQRGLSAPLPRYVIPEQREWADSRKSERVQWWYDADTAEVLAGDAMERLEGALRQHSRQRTAQDRPAWVSERGYSRVGWRAGEGEILETRLLEPAFHWSRVSGIVDIPGGWDLRLGSQSGGWYSGGIGLLVTVDAETGALRQLMSGLALTRGHEPGGWLSPRELLTWPVGVPGSVQPSSSWRIFDLDTQTSRPVPAADGSPPVQPLAVIDGRRVLVISYEKPEGFAICDLSTGALQAVPWDGPEPGPIHRAWSPSRNAVLCAVGPQVVVDLYLGRDVPPGPHIAAPGIRIVSPAWSSMRSEGFETLAHAIAVFDGATGRVRLATREVPIRGAEILGMAQDASLWLLEDARQIVRYGPKPLERQVLWPPAR